MPFSKQKFIALRRKYSFGRSILLVSWRVSVREVPLFLNYLCQSQYLQFYNTVTSAISLALIHN